MNYQTVVEALSDVYSAISCDTLNSLVKIPELTKGNCKLLYNGKPMRLLVKSERVAMGSSSNSMFDYCPSVKLDDGPSRKLVEAVTGLVIAHNDTGLPVTTKSKEYNDTKFLDLRLYDNVYATVRDNVGISEVALTELTLSAVNKLFKTGAEVTGIMMIGVHVSDKYVSVTASLDFRVYVDRRKVRTHLTHEELKETYGANLDSDNDDIDEVDC